MLKFMLHLRFVYKEKRNFHSGADAKTDSLVARSLLSSVLQF